ncbi:mobile mystery protein B [Phyllobacterium meliloti]|uniref:mobile mystery protein B n=1 Tax=Phyllobacterium meliloti TaxID=555317 RepID=UPI001D14BE28|nr:mobile mystery protein B [Phyllobacterium sp. T1293]UGX84829.1 mobile mystery protein B [Phyllobacterium sp. T1293]
MFEEAKGATPLEPDEIHGLKFSHITTRGELDELEQANIEQGLMWLARRRGGDILTDSFIRTLHVRLFGDVWNWAGSYRRSEKNIGIDPFHISMQVRMHLENARHWAENAVYTPLEAAARFHHRLVQIHPFPNGNGRHTRIAADVFLADYYGHSPMQWANGFDLQADNERRTTYLKALRNADAGDFEALLIFVGA